MQKDMQNYTNPDDYGNYGDQDRAFSPNNMEEDESTHYTKSLLYRAADDSHMEDIGTAKWQNTTRVGTLRTSGIPLPS